MLHIRPLTEKDFHGLEIAIDKRSLHHSPLRGTDDDTVRAYQKRLYRSLVSSTVSQDGRMLLMAESSDGFQGFLHLLTDYADNLYSIHQGTILDLIYPEGDKEILNALIVHAEKILTERQRHFIVILPEYRNVTEREVLYQAGFHDEYTHFITALSPSKGRREMPLRLKEASYGDIKTLLEMGAGQAGQILSPLRFLSHKALKEEYLKGHAFDWAAAPQYVTCHMVYDSSDSLLGYFTVERNRCDLQTGTEEAHLTDIIFQDFSLKQRYLAPLLQWLDRSLSADGISLRLTAIPSGDRETEALLDLIEGHHDCERVQMVKSLRRQR
ncbi:MAG: hypothetical protein AB2L14_36250 [Candidatus Xenobiia bacterium LiM19]